ncbi:MAG TPA: DUF1697 domain-containing protein [Gammaproteobacteria bacterium]|nr:DUF1697 domain-containing protein [Gammaproteobacteria bacterium]
MTAQPDTGRTQAFVALLRGINVGGRHKVPMAQLRAVCLNIGCADVRTYIQSGNLVVTVSVSAAELETKLESAIEREFGFVVPVIARSDSRWEHYVRMNPLIDDAQRDASRVLLVVSKLPPGRDAVARLRTVAAHEERIEQQSDAIWIYYASGIGRSKLTPSLLDRHVGSPVTARNWRTALRLEQIVRESADG